MHMFQYPLLVHPKSDRSPISNSVRLNNTKMRCTIGLDERMGELFKSGQYLNSTNSRGILALYDAYFRGQPGLEV